MNRIMGLSNSLLLIRLIAAVVPARLHVVGRTRYAAIGLVGLSESRARVRGALASEEACHAYLMRQRWGRRASAARPAAALRPGTWLAVHCSSARSALDTYP